jgi:3-oxoacyl-[acyl-carrier-protein] synthase-3
MDINQGCAGFIVGLYQAASIINTSDVNSVVLINGDVLSRKVSMFDRNSNPLVGDAAAITLISRINTASSEAKLVFNIKMDGSGAFALHIPAGGARLPASEETSRLMLDDAGNRRSLDNLVMKGDQVFSFVQSVVPGIIEETLKQANLSHDDIWRYALHQPNRFMLQKIAEALKVDFEKIPSNIVEEFGNSSGVTVPLVITHNFSKEMMSKNTLKTVLCGFGAGLTWGCAVADLGNMLFCKQMEV